MRTLLLISVITMLAVLTAAGQEKAIHVKGTLIDEKGKPVQGEVFLDTALNKLSWPSQDYSSPPRSEVEKGRILVPVDEHGTFEINLNSNRPYYIHFIAPDKRIASIYFPQTSLTAITLEATLFQEKLMDDSEPKLKAMIL